ncbi:hypothetical protein FB45DRAFT_37483 [Roridomyces roridus]|uniref:Uncharacterized protein n=1 Tax=Roridomyces roridus TaxID=1738132 RepID=A0AAD7BR64_9AGAR|nr:hypothetical protein FB45DRAFT_37483 [Roridomyces roridus]
MDPVVPAGNQEAAPSKSVKEIVDKAFSETLHDTRSLHIPLRPLAPLALVEDDDACRDMMRASKWCLLSASEELLQGRKGLLKGSQTSIQEALLSPPTMLFLLKDVARLDIEDSPDVVQQSFFFLVARLRVSLGALGFQRWFCRMFGHAIEAAITALRDAENRTDEQAQPTFSRSWTIFLRLVALHEERLSQHIKRIPGGWWTPTNCRPLSPPSSPLLPPSPLLLPGAWPENPVVQAPATPRVQRRATLGPVRNSGEYKRYRSVQTFRPVRHFSPMNQPPIW